MIGYGCASSIGTLVHWSQQLVESLALATQDHSKSVNALETLPIAYAYLQQLASMMSFMLESSSHFMGHLHLLLSHCHLSTMAVCYNSQRRFSSHSCAEAFGISSYNGQAFQAQKQRGKLFQTSSNPTPTSSSRTSCFRRRGEMLWLDVCTRGRRVARAVRHPATS